MVYIFYEREVSRVLNIVKAQNKPLKFDGIHKVHLQIEWYITPWKGTSSFSLNNIYRLNSLNVACITIIYINSN